MSAGHLPFSQRILLTTAFAHIYSGSFFWLTCHLATLLNSLFVFLNFLSRENISSEQRDCLVFHTQIWHLLSLVFTWNRRIVIILNLSSNTIHPCLIFNLPGNMWSCSSQYLFIHLFSHSSNTFRPVLHARHCS